MKHILMGMKYGNACSNQKSQEGMTKLYQDCLDCKYFLPT